MEVIVNDLLDRFRRYASNHTGNEIDELYEKMLALFESPSSSSSSSPPSTTQQLPVLQLPTIPQLPQLPTLSLPLDPTMRATLTNILTKELRGKEITKRSMSDSTNHAKHCAEEIIKAFNKGDVETLTELIRSSHGFKYCSQNSLKACVDPIGQYLLSL